MTKQTGNSLTEKPNAHLEVLIVATANGSFVVTAKQKQAVYIDATPETLFAATALTDVLSIVGESVSTYVAQLRGGKTDAAAATE